MHERIEPTALLRGLSERLGIANLPPMYRAESDDIFIATYPKSGTTLLQMLLYALIEGKAPDFGSIRDVSPYVDLYAEKDVDIGELATTRPRLFKTHMQNSDIFPDSVRLICCFRHPCDVSVSWYHFGYGWYVSQEEFSVDEFVRHVLWQDGWKYGFWEYFLSWYRNFGKANILPICYEDILQDKGWFIERLANFLRLPKDPQRLRITEELSSFEYMKKHGEKFSQDPANMIVQTILPASDADYVEPDYVPIVRKGKAGNYKQELAPDTFALFEERWQTYMTPATGHRSYSSFRAHVRDLFDKKTRL